MPSPPPRILHLTTVHPRTDMRIVAKEAASLAGRLGVRVEVVVADGKGPGRAGAVTISDIGRPAGGRIGRAAFGSLRALAHIRATKPAIVHFHDPELIAAGLVLKALGYKVVYDVHEDLPRQIAGKHWIPRPVRGPVAGLMRGVEWVAGKSFDAVVAATPPIAERFPPKKTVVVHNFALPGELVSADALPYARRPPVFAYVGGLSAIRGAREMVEALEHLARPDVQLELAGNFMPAGLIEAMARLPAWPRVRHHGHVDRARAAAILGRARAGLLLYHPLPNHIEALPTKLFEYMAAGLPVIASDFPEWAEIVTRERCGLLADPENPGDIARAMAAILDDPEAAAAMGARGKAAVARAYNWDAEAEKLAGLYRDGLLSG